MMQTLEELYNLEKYEVELERVQTKSGRWLDLFGSPGKVLVSVEFPEFTCLCPKTSQPDFATIELIYIPRDWCVELKSLKYYLNSFRNEGHFHEEVCCLIERDLRGVLDPIRLSIIGEFNVRGGTYPKIEVGDAF
jgi:7-cyano-7-deazaguanine reductase